MPRTVTTSVVPATGTHPVRTARPAPGSSSVCLRLEAAGVAGEGAVRRRSPGGTGSRSGSGCGRWPGRRRARRRWSMPSRRAISPYDAVSPYADAARAGPRPAAGSRCRPGASGRSNSLQVAGRSTPSSCAHGLGQQRGGRRPARRAGRPCAVAERANSIARDRAVVLDDAQRRRPGESMRVHMSVSPRSRGSVAVRCRPRRVRSPQVHQGVGAPGPPALGEACGRGRVDARARRSRVADADVGGQERRRGRPSARRAM